MRCAGLAVLCLLLTATGAAYAQTAAPTPAPPATTQPPPAPIEPPAATTPAAPEQAIGGAPVAAAPEPGRVHLVRFGPNSRPLGNVAVNLPDGSQATANADGALRITMPPGKPVLSVHAGGPTPAPIEGIEVVSGETTLVIASFDASGALTHADIQLPQAVVASPEQAAAVAAPTGPPGTVIGKVVSLEGGAPVVGAKIYARGQPGEALTDDGGNFTLQLPEGPHRLSLIHNAFSTQTADVDVVAGETTSVRVEMSPAAAELEDFVVTAPYIQGGVASLMSERRNTAAVSDSIGAEDIARMPASSAAQAAQRVVGANIVDGRFVYVRGLGERYTNALLNGVPLPSPEPDRATVPLDLFPAQILESLEISKTFTPDVPGDFAGGSVRIVTRKVPEDLVLAASLSLGMNSESTFRDGYSQESSSTDWLGFDDGQRALPDEVPSDYTVQLGNTKPDGERVSGDDLEELARQLNSRMAPVDTTLLPNMSASLAAGNSWKLGGDMKLGVLGSLIYSRNEKAIFDEFRADYRLQGADLDVWNRYQDIDTVTEAVRWGAFTSVALDLSKAHRITLIGMHSQLADAMTRIAGNGFNNNSQRNLSTIRLQYVSRGLTLGQLQGNHTFEALNDAELDWTLAGAFAVRDEPDTRDVVYQFEPGGSETWSFAQGSDSGRHFFSEQDEDSKTAAIDWKQPITDGFVKADLKTGGMVTFRDRDFQARRFLFQEVRGADESFFICGEVFDPIACPSELFVDENIGSQLRAQEGTDAGKDAYRAALYVYAAYLMGEVGLGEQWRLIGGARVEATDQSISPYDQFSGMDNEGEANELKSTDVLPSVSLVFSPTEETSIRTSVTQTIARPQLRELAPFAFSDYFGGAIQSGNPDLVLTSILNYDVRFEFFPSAREVLALSFFAKDFTDPIEPIFIPGSETNIQSYDNTPSAFLFGAEVEVRKTLDFVHEGLDDFTAIASLMLADSQIEVEQTGTRTLTNTERPMVESAPYVVNASLDYENENRTQARLLYNVTGTRLVEVGTRGLDDSYAHPRHMFDFTASQGFGNFQLRATIQNILNAELLVTQGKDDRGNNIRARYREGISASIGVSYTH